DRTSTPEAQPLLRLRTRRRAHRRCRLCREVRCLRGPRGACSTATSFACDFRLRSARRLVNSFPQESWRLGRFIESLRCRATFRPAVVALPSPAYNSRIRSPGEVAMQPTTARNCVRGHPLIGDGLFCQSCGAFQLDSEGTVTMAGRGERLLSWFVNTLLVFLTLIIGWIIWWFIVAP